MSDILQELSLVSPVVCITPDCVMRGKKYDHISYCIADEQYVDDTFASESGFCCPSCNNKGFPEKHYKRLFELRDDGLHLSLKFDDASLDTLIGILRNMQDGDVVNTEQVFLAHDEAFNLSDSFRVIDEQLLLNVDVPFGTRSSRFDEFNKVIIATPKSIRLSVDISEKVSSQSHVLTTLSRQYTLMDLLKLKEVARLCTEEKSDNLVFDGTEEDLLDEAESQLQD